MATSNLTTVDLTLAVGGLKSLAAAIDPARFSCRMVEYRRRPALRVISLEATALTETIVAVARAEAVEFYWSWGDLLGTSDDIQSAAHRVIYVLSLPDTRMTLNPRNG